MLIKKKTYLRNQMKYLFSVQIIVLFSVSIGLNRCQPQATGRCGLPVVPPKATLLDKSVEKLRFSHNEDVVIKCSKDEFMPYEHRVKCNNGKWMGKRPRCGRNMDAQITHLDILDCESPENNLLLSQQLNQSENDENIPINAFNRYRVDDNTKLWANGSKCYTYRLTFNRKIQFWFLTINIRVDGNTSLPKLIPNTTKYRTCELIRNTQEVDRPISDRHSINFQYYFICDLNSDSDYSNEQKELSNTISFNIITNFTGNIGLEGVFIGDVFTDSKNKPECGEIQVENLGIDVADNFGYNTVICNDSFVDLNRENVKRFSENGNPKHYFKCNRNGEWKGSWPVFMPINPCPKHTIMADKPNGVVIEEIGNVYYLNESQWFAINDSYVRYSCLNENHIMVGKEMRTCLKDGKWSSKAPYCTSTGISGYGIAGILFAVLIVFVLIVLFVFRMHSKRVKSELKDTRNEIQETNRKRLSDESYADIGDDDTYDVPGADGKVSTDYETVDYSEYHQPRYQLEPHQEPDPDYLVMFAPRT